MNKLPNAKLDNIAVQDLKHELLVYNLTTHQAYTLNETSKIIFNSCDGQTSFDELERKYKFKDDLIHFALDELRLNGLIESEMSGYFQGLSRRAVIKRVGLSSLAALPIIAALSAPMASHAASSCPDPRGINIPSGCPFDGPIVIPNQTCASYPDAGKEYSCSNNLNGYLACQSRSAPVYRPNSCTNSNGNIIFSCNCS